MQVSILQVNLPFRFSCDAVTVSLTASFIIIASMLHLLGCVALFCMWVKLAAALAECATVDISDKQVGL